MDADLACTNFSQENYPKIQTLIFKAWGLVPVPRTCAPQIRSGLRPLCLERLFRFFSGKNLFDSYENTG